MSDICERLRKEIPWEQEVGELLEEAIAEIERLRPTHAERAAIEWASRAADPDYTGHTATLRGLLDRIDATGSV